MFLPTTGAGFPVKARALILPSPVGGRATETVGYFAVECEVLADWLTESLGTAWNQHKSDFNGICEATPALRTSRELDRYLCIPMDNWTALLSNGPLSTDVGVLPSHAARELGCRAMRAVCIEPPAKYPARLLEVFGPGGDPALLIERSIAAANDGGRWIFETSGKPYAFESTSTYARRVKSARFTSEMLHDYLIALGVPLDAEPDWKNARLVAKRDEEVTSPRS